MKKMTLFVSQRNVDWDLSLLGKLGVVHLNPFQPPVDESIDRVAVRIEQMKTALEILAQYESEAPTGRDRDLELKFAEERGEISLMDRILIRNEWLVKAENILNTLEHELGFYESWGNVSIRDVEFLRKSGVFVRLFEVNEKDMESIRSREDIFVFGENDKKFHIAQISLGAEALGFPEFAIPKREPKTLQDAILKTKNVILETKKELAQLATHKALLQDALNERIRRFDVRNVQFSGIVEEKAFRYWEGYVPVDSVDSVKELAEENNWGYCFEDPTGAELKKVPTKLKRNKLSSSVDILLEKAVPGYTERDYSSVFLFFYAVFAAMLIGDGGYGLLVLLVTLFFHRKNNWHAKEGHLLGYLLGGFIVSWGAITGTWFGYGEFSGLPILRNLVIPEMSSFQTGKNELALDSILFMMRFSFLIGAIQLSVGRLLSAYKAFQEKSWSALSDIGWVINTWAMFIVIKVLFTPSEGGLEFPSFMKYFFYVGIACAVLSQILQHGILKGILGSLGDLWGGFQGAFQDLLSYVRLQAVGFVTVVMGFVFNFLAELSGNIIAGILIVLIGHSLNMALAYLGFIVHGSRLNLNEMGSKLNAGLQGRRYRPFTLNIN